VGQARTKQALWDVEGTPADFKKKYLGKKEENTIMIQEKNKKKEREKKRIFNVKDPIIIAKGPPRERGPLT
jgi:hypothetical protein